MNQSDSTRIYFPLSVLVGFITVLWIASAQAGSPSNLPSPTAWVTNGQVDAIVIDGATTYIGGQFTKVGGASRNNLAHIKSDGAW